MAGFWGVSRAIEPLDSNGLKPHKTGDYQKFKVHFSSCFFQKEK